MNDKEVQAWHDRVLRDLAEVKLKIERYLHTVEGSQKNDPTEFDNQEILMAMKNFELGVDQVANYVTRMYTNYKKMGQAAGNA